jgi:iron(III) transport system substrate-binding protein
MKAKLVVSVGLAICVAISFLLAAPVLAATPAPKLAASVTAFGGSGAVEIDGEVAKFIEKELGVKVKFDSLSHGVIHSRVIAEAPRFSADICWNVGFPLMVEAKEKGWSVAYDSPNWRGSGDVFVDPDGYWWNNGNWAFVLVGNKDLLAKKGYTLPTSWEELLDPKWKNNIIMPSPATSGTAFMMLYSFTTLYGFNVGKGEEGGWEYLEALNKNIHHFTRGGNVPSDLVGRGEFMLGISSDEMVLPRIKEGYPLVWCVPKEGIGYGSAGAIIFKGTEKLYTCQKIIDLFGTTKFCKFWSGLAGYVTKDPKAVSALYGKIPKYIPNINQAWAVANKGRIIDEWVKKIGRVPKK